MKTALMEIPMIFDLYRQFPLDEKPTRVLFDLDKNGLALCFQSDGKEMARLNRAKVDYIAANGIKVSGFEVINPAKMEYKYQEWWLAYSNSSCHR